MCAHCPLGPTKTTAKHSGTATCIWTPTLCRNERTEKSLVRDCRQCGFPKEYFLKVSPISIPPFPSLISRTRSTSGIRISARASSAESCLSPGQALVLLLRAHTVDRSLLTISRKPEMMRTCHGTYHNSIFQIKCTLHTTIHPHPPFKSASCPGYASAPPPPPPPPRASSGSQAPQSHALPQGPCPSSRCRVRSRWVSNRSVSWAGRRVGRGGRQRRGWRRSPWGWGC